MRETEASRFMGTGDHSDTDMYFFNEATKFFIGEKDDLLRLCVIGKNLCLGFNCCSQAAAAAVLAHN